MILAGYLLLLLVLLYFLSTIASLLLPIISTLGRRLGLSEYTVGFLILGTATSLPELSVAINSAIYNTPQLSFGNLLGGIIVLLSLLCGLAATVCGKVPFKGTLTNGQLWFAAVVNLSPLILILDGRLSRLDGIVLMAIYAAYLFYLGTRNQHIEHDVKFSSHSWTKLIIKVAVGLTALYLVAHWSVLTALKISEVLLIPPLLIGVVLLSVGTNLPELASTLKIRKNHTGLTLGHLLGSSGANTFIAGLLAFIAPFSITGLGSIAVMGISLVVVVILFNIALRTDNHLSRKEGVALLGVYLLFVFFNFFSSQWWG